MVNRAASAFCESGTSRAIISDVNSPVHSIFIRPIRPIIKPQAISPGRALIDPIRATKYSQKAASPLTRSLVGAQAWLLMIWLWTKIQFENFGSFFPRMSVLLNWTPVNRQFWNLVFNVWTLLKFVSVKLQSLKVMCL